MKQNEFTCIQVVDLIGAYLDEDLPTETRRPLEAHLLGCITCAYEAQSLRITKERLRGDVGEVIASDSLRARTLRLLYADNPHLVSETEAVPVETTQFSLPIRF